MMIDSFEDHSSISFLTLGRAAPFEIDYLSTLGALEPRRPGHKCCNHCVALGCRSRENCSLSLLMSLLWKVTLRNVLPQQ
jgi:hypothetical protein